MIRLRSAEEVAADERRPGEDVATEADAVETIVVEDIEPPSKPEVVEARDALILREAQTNEKK